jgi:hypothetical protein
MTAMLCTEAPQNVVPGPHRTHAPAVNIRAFSPFHCRFRNLIERFFNSSNISEPSPRAWKSMYAHLAPIKIAATRI